MKKTEDEDKMKRNGIRIMPRKGVVSLFALVFVCFGLCLLCVVAETGTCRRPGTTATYLSFVRNHGDSSSAHDLSTRPPIVVDDTPNHMYRLTTTIPRNPRVLTNRVLVQFRKSSDSPTAGNKPPEHFTKTGEKELDPAKFSSQSYKYSQSSGDDMVAAQEFASFTVHITPLLTKRGSWLTDSSENR